VVDKGKRFFDKEAKYKKKRKKTSKQTKRVNKFNRLVAVDSIREETL